MTPTYIDTVALILKAAFFKIERHDSWYGQFGYLLRCTKKRMSYLHKMK
jgi:hypothetical protein